MLQFQGKRSEKEMLVFSGDFYYSAIQKEKITQANKEQSSSLN